ncbi:50S ribosomal protein L9 [Candidatus Kaiserbacteria bacterium]|nr:50S ribosomal protein L9 [Candidatus Kaiserbacteria bacterium]
MKVILLKDVGGVGQRDTLKEVSDGHALNFLIPRGFAVQATPEKVKELTARKNAVATEVARMQKEWEASAAKIHGKHIRITAKTNSHGSLYQQLTPEIIEIAIREQLGVEIPQDALILNAPIKSIGKWDVEIQHNTITARCVVDVKGSET